MELGWANAANTINNNTLQRTVFFIFNYLKNVQKYKKRRDFHHPKTFVK